MVGWCHPHAVARPRCWPWRTTRVVAHNQGKVPRALGAPRLHPPTCRHHRRSRFRHYRLPLPHTSHHRRSRLTWMASSSAAWRRATRPSLTPCWRHVVVATGAGLVEWAAAVRVFARAQRPARRRRCQHSMPPAGGAACRLPVPQPGGVARRTPQANLACWAHQRDGGGHRQAVGATVRSEVQPPLSQRCSRWLPGLQTWGASWRHWRQRLPRWKPSLASQWQRQPDWRRQR